MYLHAYVCILYIICIFFKYLGKTFSNKILINDQGNLILRIFIFIYLYLYSKGYINVSFTTGIMFLTHTQN